MITVITALVAFTLGLIAGTLFVLNFKKFQMGQVLELLPKTEALTNELTEAVSRAKSYEEQALHKKWTGRKSGIIT